MERLRCLAREALSWAWLTPQQRLVWAAAIKLDAVPLQERGAPVRGVGLGRSKEP